MSGNRSRCVPQKAVPGKVGTTRSVETEMGAFGSDTGRLPDTHSQPTTRIWYLGSYDDLEARTNLRSPKCERGSGSRARKKVGPSSFVLVWPVGPVEARGEEPFKASKARTALTREEHERRLVHYVKYKFSMYTPSMIAAASIAAALHGLDWTGKSGFGLAGLFDELTRITAIEQDYLRGCLEQIEEMVSQVQGGHVNGDGNANGDTGVDGHQVVSMSVSSGQQRPLGEQTTSQEKKNDDDDDYDTSNNGCSNSSCNRSGCSSSSSRRTRNNDNTNIDNNNNDIDNNNDNNSNEVRYVIETLKQTETTEKKSKRRLK
uniref:Cyclin C-terminal domain-containing protein n=1 Tax=Vespula pensylvanica TaxID=30213 RepID=A0A834NIS7_VESPE|nr:hypothetical protein H0235_013845 [Vespula pensylvanica]